MGAGAPPFRVVTKAPGLDLDLGRSVLLETAVLGGESTGRWTWLASPLNSTSSVSKSTQTARMISSMGCRCRSANTLCRYLVTKTK
jgi:hypothetical protein